MVNEANAEPVIALVMVPLELIGIFLEFAATSSLMIGPFGAAASADVIENAAKITATHVVLNARNCFPPYFQLFEQG
jgi:hypothetical protein